MFTSATVFRLFDPIVREVDRLITEQVNDVKIERLQATPSNPNGVKVWYPYRRAMLPVLLKTSRLYFWLVVLALVGIYGKSSKSRTQILWLSNLKKREFVGITEKGHDRLMEIIHRWSSIIR